MVFAGLPDRYESEGFDRDDMKLPEGHVRMIEAVAETNPNTVVVLSCGSAVECPWAGRVKAILYMGLGGQAVGEAARDLLYGEVNPSGKLAETWPMRYADCVSSSYYGTKDAQYREGVYVGYRYYEKAGIPVRWSFGHGLSYTIFANSGLTADSTQAAVTVPNSGKVPGAEVVQLYIAPPKGSGYRPLRELKGFQKVFLQPGESKTVTFRLTDRSFAVWQDGWKVPAGTYTVQVGGLSADIQVAGEAIDLRRGDWYDSPAGIPSQDTWEKLLGRNYVAEKLIKGKFTMDNSIMEMKDHSLVMNIMYKAVESTVAKGFGGKKDYSDPQFRMLMTSSAGSSLQSMQISGGIKGGLMPGLLEMANGHFFRGIGKIIKG